VTQLEEIQIDTEKSFAQWRHIRNLLILNTCETHDCFLVLRPHGLKILLDLQLQALGFVPTEHPATQEHRLSLNSNNWNIFDWMPWILTSSDINADLKCTRATCSTTIPYQASLAAAILMMSINEQGFFEFGSAMQRQELQQQNRNNGFSISLYQSKKFALNLTRLLNNNVDEQTLCHSISRGITTWYVQMTKEEEGWSS